MSVCGYESAEAFLADGVLLSRKLTSGNAIQAINALIDANVVDSSRLQEALGPQRYELIRKKRTVLRTDQVGIVLKATEYDTLSDLIDAAKTLAPPSQLRVHSKDQGGVARDR